MRLPGPRCRVSAVAAVVLAVAAGVSLASLLTTTDRAALAAEAIIPLSVTVDRQLSSLVDPVTLAIEGSVPNSLVGTKLVIRVKGPAALSQVGTIAPDLPEANKIVKVLGETPSTTSPTLTDAEVEEAPTTTTSSTTTTGPTLTSTAEDLQAGSLMAEMTLSPGVPAQAGAYLVVVEIKSDQDVWAVGQTWVGKADVRETQLDLAFVWPVSLGIHRDADGVFYDRVLEQAVASESGDLRAPIGLPARYGGWHFTVAVEPVLLTQLRDMADGYVRSDVAGNQVDVPKSSTEARNAEYTLEAFKTLAADGSTQIAVGPYSGADLSILATEGWRDGFEQIQLGKQELQQTLGLGAPLTGACSPDLSLTTDSLSYYADASIDHLVVGSDLAGLMTEQLEEGTVAVRARDAENDRVTLVFADSTLSATMEAPWDIGVFCAALAAELASTPRNAVVVVPPTEFALPPASYLDSLARILTETEWVNTQTLTELLRSHSADTRPILLKTGAGGAQGYIEESLLEELQSAHAAVTDLAAIADASRTSVETARGLLYMAESRWWSRPGTSPGEASVGLSYSRQARELARGELAKVRFGEFGSTTITGEEGEVSLEIENDAGYSLVVAVRLGGTGLTLPGGDESEVELAPGRTTMLVEVRSADGPHILTAQLIAGDSTLAEASHSLRFITITTVLPAIVVGALALMVGAFFLVRWIIRKVRAVLAARAAT